MVELEDNTAGVASRRTERDLSMKRGRLHGSKRSDYEAETNVCIVVWHSGYSSAVSAEGTYISTAGEANLNFGQKGTCICTVCNIGTFDYLTSVCECTRVVARNDSRQETPRPEDPGAASATFSKTSIRGRNPEWRNP